MYTINSLRASENDLSLAERPSVSISKPSNYKQGLYTLTTSPLDWVVHRKGEDFNWLRSCLSTMYPSIFIPPSPPKDIKSEDFILICLQRQMNLMLKNSILRTSPYLLAFLKESDEKDFNSIKKEAKRTRKPDCVSENWSVTGNIVCDSTEDRNSARDLKDYIAQTEKFRCEIKKQSGKLLENFEKTSKVLYNLSQSFLSLENLQEKYTEIPPSSHAYSALRNSFEAWSNLQNQFMNIIQDNLFNYFKYAAEEIKGLRNLSKERENKLQSFSKFESKLISKKEKTWIAEKKEGDKEQAFREMFPEETSALGWLKHDFAHFNYQLYVETKQYFLENQEFENTHFTVFANSMHKMFEQFAGIWTDLETLLSKIRQEFLIHE